MAARVRTSLIWVMIVMLSDFIIHKSNDQLASAYTGAAPHTRGLGRCGIVTLARPWHTNQHHEFVWASRCVVHSPLSGNETINTCACSGSVFCFGTSLFGIMFLSLMAYLISHDYPYVLRGIFHVHTPHHPHTATSGSGMTPPQSPLCHTRSRKPRRCTISGSPSACTFCLQWCRAPPSATTARWASCNNVTTRSSKNE